MTDADLLPLDLPTAVRPVPTVRPLVCACGSPDWIAVKPGTASTAEMYPRFLAEYKAHSFFRIMHLPYVMPGYLGRALGGDEYAYWFGSVVASVAGRRVIPGRGPAAQPSQRPANGHPMSRAQVHFDWLVNWCVDPDESVLDPFMGSGTTGVACAMMGVPFTGIEKHEPYFDIACRRIEASHQASLFAPPRVPAPVTPDMFAEIA